MTGIFDALTPTVYRGIAVALIILALVGVLLDLSGVLPLAGAALVAAGLSLHKHAAAERQSGFHHA